MLIVFPFLFAIGRLKESLPFGTGLVAEAKVGFIAGTQDRSDRTEGHCPGRAPGEMVEVEGRQT